MKRVGFTGTVYLVGAGPGDPALLTLRGAELLRRADVVIYDHLVAPQLLTLCSSSARIMYAGKGAGRPDTTRQRAINRRLIREARAGRTVIRLKGGDPFVFGRGGEEALALAEAKIPYEVVPGVTSAVAVPAYAGIPVTHRHYASSVTIMTGHEHPDKPQSAIRWNELAKVSDTLVCLMSVKTLPMITGKLMQYGRSATTPCAVIEWGATPRQRTVTGTLKTIAQRAARAAIQPPATLVVGHVVKLRAQLNWFETRPLFGKRIVVTRATEKAGPLVEQLEALGAQVEQLPAIELVPVAHNGLFRDAVQAIPQTDWVFFTSPESIERFVTMLKPYRKDLRWLSGCHIGAIGPKTAAAVEAAGLHVDFIPRQFRQEGVLMDLPRRVLDGKRALIVCAEGSRDVLADGLRKRGMRVMKVPIYRAVVPPTLRRHVLTVFKTPVDAVTVTSASCVEHLHRALQVAGKGPLFRRLRFASIGPVTSRAVRARGGRVVIEANVSTIEGLVNALSKMRR